MKAYVKPDIEVTTFMLNETVATCEVTYETSYPEQTITCIVDGSETVFYTSCSKSASNGKLVVYDDTTYYVWYNGYAGSIPSGEQQKLLAALGITESGWHAGVATDEITSIVNSSI